MSASTNERMRWLSVFDKIAELKDGWNGYRAPRPRQVADREVTAEFYNNGTAHGLFVNSSTETMETRSITANESGYIAFLDEVWHYLYGRALV